MLGEWCKQTTEAVELFRSYHSIKEEKGVVDAKIWDKLADEVKKKDEKVRHAPCVATNRFVEASF